MSTSAAPQPVPADSNEAAPQANQDRFQEWNGSEPAGKLVEWLNKYVQDKVLQALLVGIVAVSLVAGTLRSAWDGSFFNVLSSLAMLAAFALFVIFLRVLAVAFQTVPDDTVKGASSRLKAARTAQVNARYSLMILMSVGFSLYLLASLWRAAWRDMEVGFYQTLWGSGLASLKYVVENVRPTGEYGRQFLLSEIVTMAPDEIGRWLNANNIIQQSGYGTAFSLIAKREVAEISGTLNVNGIGIQRTAIIAAKEIVLKPDARVIYGSTDVMLIAYRFRFEDGSQIRAFRDEDIPLAVRDEATTGAHAGTLRIVALGPYQGKGKVSIDAFGQIGSDGPDGKEGPTRLAVQGQKPKVLPNRPAWAFRPYKPEELDKATKAIDEMLNGVGAVGTANGDVRRQLLDARRQIESCRGAAEGAARGEKCRALLCNEDMNQWARDSRGKPGLPGLPGTVGVSAGESGHFGKVYISMADQEHMQAAIQWMDRTPIDELPKPKEGAHGGLSGPTGPGGPGEPGAAADPLAVCIAGIQGENGERPPNDQRRARSAPWRVAERATLQPIRP